MPTYIHVCTYFVGIQLDMEVESMYEPLPSQKSTSMDSSRIEVSYIG